MCVSAELKCCWAEPTATLKPLWRCPLLPAANWVLTIQNAFQGHCPERRDCPFAPKRAKKLPLPDQNFFPSLWHPHYKSGLSTSSVTASFFLFCLAMFTAYWFTQLWAWLGLWVLQVANTIGATLLQSALCHGNHICCHPVPPPTLKLPLSCAVSHSWGLDGQRQALLGWDKWYLKWGGVK